MDDRQSEETRSEETQSETIPPHRYCRHLNVRRDFVICVLSVFIFFIVVKFIALKIELKELKTAIIWLAEHHGFPGGLK